jgi:hypothetical protein
MPREREKQVKFFATDEELEKIKLKVEKSKLSQSDYLRKVALQSDIVVIEGLNELTIELKRIGNNINQLTRLAHEGKVNCSQELQGINEEMKEVWQSLRQLIQKAR